MTEAKLHRKKTHNAIFLSLLVCWFTSLRFMDLFLCSPSIMQNSSSLNPTGRVEVGNEDNGCCSSCLFFLLCISEVVQWLRTKGTQVKNPGRFVLPVFAQVFPAGGRREVRHRSGCCWTSCQLFQTKTPPTNYMLHAVWLCGCAYADCCAEYSLGHTLVPSHPTLISPIPPPTPLAR